MDILLSLPIFSYFAAPMLGSWSSSLNFLFFYMTWATLVFSHSPLKIEVVGTLAIRIVFWLIPSILSLLVDALLPGLVGSIKFFGSVSLPPRSALVQARQALLAIANLVLLTALEAGISTVVGFLLQRAPLKTSTALPLPWKIIKHMFILYAAREVLTYYAHRCILHNSSGSIAKFHSQYAHQRTGAAPYSLMLYADHPVPLIFTRLVPVYLPALVLGPHILTYFIFTLLTTVEEMLCMSGYSAVPGILMGDIARRTATHYASNGRGNYGVWGLLDYIHGTSVGNDAVSPSESRDETQKAQVKVKERARKAVTRNSAKSVQEGINSLRKSRKGWKVKKEHGRE
ncbi:sterol desaturase family [Xylaria sp. CBS 124048]|nr:sterol desaturase family [Xylaria sp. CBS 124048]